MGPSVEGTICSDYARATSVAIVFLVREAYTQLCWLSSYAAAAGFTICLNVIQQNAIMCNFGEIVDIRVVNALCSVRKQEVD